MLVLLALPCAGLAAQDMPASSELSRLAACRDLAPDQRLGCYDRTVATLLQDERQGRIVISERADSRETAEQRFGRRRPARPARDRSDREGSRERFTELTSTIGSVASGTNGWTFTLANGARWTQSEAMTLVRTPRAGDAIRIRRGPLGNFLANIAGGPAIRVRRID